MNVNAKCTDGNFVTWRKKQALWPTESKQNAYLEERLGTQYFIL